MHLRPLFTVLALSLLAAAGLGGQTRTTAPAQPAKPALEPGLYATMVTSKGRIVMKLYEQEAPVTVKNFIDLALGRKSWVDPRTNRPTRKPLYNGLTFHRVIKGFMIQGGDPLGTGEGDVETIPDEFHPTLKFDVPGRLAMANAGPNTGSCQFFITEVPTPHLNGRHTIFGQVVEGQEVVNAIASVPTNAEDAPLTPVRIVSITFRRIGPAPANDPLGPPRRPAAKKIGPAK